ncbi:MAG TPA: acetyl-CoA carboxylase biotin carboxyl carrier protein [Usitatibacter sp.]|nr:acetyl-CoA carboxylase biotin carboxyl carrier protein [Usitatibacter sp.]
MKKRSPEKRRAAPATATPARTPGYDDLLAIARLIESGSRFTEFRLRSGDIEVEVKRANGAAAPIAPMQSAPAEATLPPPNPKGGGASSPESTQGGGAPIPELPAGTHLIKSPMVGTFYRAPEPGAKPFVEPGTKVEPDTIVCIIEVMKLMNSVEAGVSGTVTHVFADNAAMVEAGQPLIAIRP